MVGSGSIFIEAGEWEGGMDQRGKWDNIRKQIGSQQWVCMRKPVSNNGPGLFLNDLF